MARVTRKLWVGIGWAAIVGAPLGGGLTQDSHAGHQLPATIGDVAPPTPLLRVARPI